jgi:hypothetical protein
MVYPGKLNRNIDCGMCMECLKTCPKNNIALNMRPFGTDLTVQKAHKLDEAYKALIMLACALVYSVVLLGPWGELKNAANMQSMPHWLAYATGFLTFVLVFVPGVFGVFSAASWLLMKRALPLRQVFIDFAYTLVPMGLAAWIAFSLGFVLVNGSYALSVLSDPFGWGWDLFNTASAAWTPAPPQLIAFLQTGVLIAGFLFSVQTGYKIAWEQVGLHRKAFTTMLPNSFFLILVTFTFMWLYLG